jgi:hypothetical protein
LCPETGHFVMRVFIGAFQNSFAEKQPPDKRDTSPFCFSTSQNQHFQGFMSAAQIPLFPH